MRCKRIFSIFVILTIVLSLGTCAMASSDKDSIIGAMKNESKENLVPYIELLGFNTTENSLSVSEEFLNNIDRVIIMGLLGTCEHSYSSSANGKIDILEWVSNNEISKNAFLEYISFLNNYFGETATLNSYDNLSDETYHWIDYENLCMVYCWLSDTNQVCIRWYWEEDYVSSLNVTGTVFSDNSKNPSNETKNQEAVSVLSCSSELSSSSYYAVDFKIQNNLEVSIHTITLNVIFTDEEGNTVNATYPQEPQRLRPGKTQVMDALCKVDLFPVKVYIDAISFYDEEENYHKFYLEDPEEFNVIPDAVTATPISTVIPTSAPTVP